MYMHAEHRKIKHSILSFVSSSEYSDHFPERKTSYRIEPGAASKYSGEGSITNFSSRSESDTTLRG